MKRSPTRFRYSLVFCLLLGACGGSTGSGGGNASTSSDASSSQRSASVDDVVDCNDVIAPQDPVPSDQTELTINGSGLLLDGEPFVIKGVVFETFYPGEGPGTADSVPDDMPYYCMLSKAKEMGANTVYSAFGEVEQMQEAYFKAAAALDINIIVGIWFSGEADDYRGNSGDFQNPAFKDHVRNHIKATIDRLHTGFSEDYSGQVIYLNLGNEFSETAVNNTNNMYNDMTPYSGTHVSAPSGANPTESFLAEMADYAKGYEQNTYGVTHPVTHTTWPVVSPSSVDTGFLDIVSYNLYSYWPLFVAEHAPGSVTGTAYQGALEELAGNAADRPFVVSEFGRSTAPESDHDGAGSEDAQADELLGRWRDIAMGPANVVGGLIFELVDQWHKNDFEHAGDADSRLTHDSGDAEEWFGVIELSGDRDAPVFKEKHAFSAIKAEWAGAE